MTREDRGGATFTAAEVRGSQLLDVSFTDAQHGWMIDGDGGVSVTTDGGATWTTTVLGDRTVQLAGIAMADARTGWIITGTGDLLFTAVGGH